MANFKVLVLFASLGFIGISCGAKNKEVEHDDGDRDGGLAPIDPNRAHINIWDFGRGVQYIDLSDRAEAYDFFAPHVDVAESEEAGVSELRKRNPDIKVFRYELDITACQHVGCVRSREVAEDPPGALESFYLHFSENTEFTVHFVDPADETVSIKGCSGKITRECRVQTGIWSDYRWVYNPANPKFRTWMANRLLEVGKPYNGIFLDEHGPGLAINWPKEAIGGGIVEYGGRRADEIAKEYNADLAAALAVYKETLGAQNKFVVINGAEWSIGNALVMDQIKAAGGTVTEFLHRPDSFDGATWYREALGDIDELVAAGALVDLHDTPCRDVEGGIGFTPGNYSSAFARWQMWRLASYYLARELPDNSAETGMVYFDPGLCVQFGDPDHALDFIDEWLPAYDVDVGNPDGPRAPENFASGPAPEAAACTGQTTAPEYGVLSRSYDNGKVLVLVRPKDRWDCTLYGDDTAVSVNLPSAMRLLSDDGSLSEPLSTIQLCNAEAAILFK